MLARQLQVCPSHPFFQSLSFTFVSAPTGCTTRIRRT